jgi:hypothetical protein
MSRTFLVGLILSLAACSDKTPSAIAVPQSSLTFYEGQRHPLGAVLTNKAGEHLTAPALTFSSTPADIVVISTTGEVACLKSGDASVLIAGGGQSATVTVACRIVATIDAPKSLRLVLGREPEELAVTPRDAAGSPMPGVPVTFLSSSPPVVRVVGTKLEPVAVGRAGVQVQSGSASISVPVTVVRVMESKPLILKDGEQVTYTLQQGTYELDLEVKPSDGGKTGVTVSWIGAKCQDSAEAQSHNVSCRVDATASLTVKNPSVLGLGPSMTGFLNLYEAPGQ